MASAKDLIKERYTPFRAEAGKRLPFETANYRTVCSPYDLEPIASVGFMSEAQAFENLETLVRTHKENRIPKTHERIALMMRAARRLEDRAEELADLIAWEGGKPLADARVEVARAINSLEYAAQEAGRWHGTEVPMTATKAASGRVAFTYPEPIGVVFAISAFNHPLNLIAHQVAPAIAVGCPVLIKPASEVPLSCLHFMDALYEAGLPPEMALPLLCENEVAEKIVRTGELGFLSFIGSAKVGWHLRSILKPGVRLSLEHGGSAPVIVDASADLDVAIPTVVKGGYYHAGQVCVSTQRVFVQEDIMPEFQERLMGAVRALKTGNPRLENIDCGPIIRERDLTRIHDTVSEAVKNGARLLLGGQPLGKTTYAPTILRGASESERVMREEIFGPVVVLESFREMQDGIASANNVDGSFQAAVFCRDLDRSLEAARGLRASAVMVNDSTAFRVDWMPFRGNGPSGFGTGGIPFSMHDLTNEKMVVIKSKHFEI